MLNQKILNSIGRQNYNQYMLLTNGKEVDEILDSYSPIFELYKYRDKIFIQGKGQNVDISELERELKNNNDTKLKQQLELLFLESLSNSKFKIVKDMLVKHELGWSISKLVEVHKNHKGNRIFRILSIKYEDWLN